MDEVEIFVADEDRPQILRTLEELDVSYAVTAGAPPQDDRVKVSFPIPSDGVEPVLEELEGVGLDADEDYTVVSDPDFARSATEQDLREEYARTPSTITEEALDTKVWDMRRDTRAFFWLMVLSTAIATVGLLISAPAIIVGSMVITPLLTPTLSVGVGAVLGDTDMVWEGVTSQLFGLAVAAVVSAGLSFVFKMLRLVPRTLAVTDLTFVAARLAPSALVLLVGAAAGAAAAYGLATKETTILAGVAIAGALLPVATVVGIAVAWGEWAIAVGATGLFLLGVFSINAAAAATLGLLGYRPSDEIDRSLPSGAHGAFVVAVAVLLVVLVVGVAVGTVQQTEFERNVDEEATALLSNEEYNRLDVIAIDAGYVGVGSPDGQTVVTVVISRPADLDHPQVAAPLEERLTAAGYDVVVRVRYQEYQRAE